jgi:hypothetical protein
LKKLTKFLSSTFLGFKKKKRKRRRRRKKEENLSSLVS